MFVAEELFALRSPLAAKFNPLFRRIVAGQLQAKDTLLGSLVWLKAMSPFLLAAGLVSAATLNLLWLYQAKRNAMPISGVRNYFA